MRIVVTMGLLVGTPLCGPCLQAGLAQGLTSSKVNVAEALGVNWEIRSQRQWLLSWAQFL